MVRYPESFVMRLATLLALLAIITAPALAFAQSKANGQPLPAVPPPPPEMVPFDAALEPQVTIRKRDTDTVEEFRVRGKLYMIKVTPSSGPAYYLMDKLGDGTFSSMDTMDANLRVPQWVIGTF
jgi:hypothetical protein